MRTFASRVTVASVAAVGVIACSSSSTSPSSGDAGASTSATIVHLTDCLSQPLAGTGPGTVDARVFVVLGGTTTCKDAGLAVADAASLASLQSRFTIAAGAAVCEVAQAVKTDYVDGNCVKSLKPSFCYVAPFDLPPEDGGAGKHCDETILFSSAFATLVVTDVYVVFTVAGD